jgi:hypothetical protein
MPVQIGDIANKNQKFVLKYIQPCINVLLELIKVSNVLIMHLLVPPSTFTIFGKKRCNCLCYIRSVGKIAMAALMLL